MKTDITTIDKYIELCPDNIQNQLQELRLNIKSWIPEATEKISWGMPTFHYHKNIVHFAAHKHHIGIYPGDKAIAFYEKELAAYKTSKGAVQFPYTKKLPYSLIKKLVLYSRKENGN